MSRSAVDSSRIRDRFLRRIRNSFLVRFHMAIILFGTALSGVLYSKVLLELHLHSMAVRFPLAVAFSYLTFFLFVKLWLGYISRAAEQSMGTADGVDVADALILPDGAGVAGQAPVSFGGGGSGGGGAGGSFGSIVDPADSVDASPLPSSAPIVAEESSGAAEKGASGASALLEFDDAAAVLAVLALAAVVVAIAGGYLIYDAPNILPDAAWEAALAAGMFRGMKRMNATDWAGSVFRATWKPFACILAICFLVAFVGGKIYPDARSVVDLWRAARAAP